MKMLDERILANADDLKIIAHTGGSVGKLVDEFAYSKVCQLKENPFKNTQN